MTTAETIDCPLCGREMGPLLTRHRRSDLWTPQQIWLVRKLRARGISQKAIAGILGVMSRDIANLEARLRQQAAP